jgi:PBP1b-binding outer membrane lipoprotein LpoB
MDIKIPSGPPQGGAIDTVQDAPEAGSSAVETTEVSKLSSETVDSISTVAEQVARGEIDSNKAVEQILADILDSDMVNSAPKELKKELGEILKSLLETDPYLQSLAAAIGPARDK